MRGKNHDFDPERFSKTIKFIWDNFETRNLNYFKYGLKNSDHHFLEVYNALIIF